MIDKIIREVFHQEVLSTEHSDAGTLVLDEFSLRNGGCRADIAVLNGKMVGYEIKTDRDNLMRLAIQASAYNEVFDDVYLIVGSKHLNKAIDLIPEWWGIFLIESDTEGNIGFKLIRVAQKNICKNKVGLLQLLWKEEILKLLNETLEIKVANYLTKKQLYAIVQEHVSDNELTNYALTFLKTREGWRTGRRVPFENVD